MGRCRFLCIRKRIREIRVGTRGKLTTALFTINFIDYYLPVQISEVHIIRFLISHTMHLNAVNKIAYKWMLTRTNNEMKKIDTILTKGDSIKRLLLAWKSITKAENNVLNCWYTPNHHPPCLTKQLTMGEQVSPN